MGSLERHMVFALWHESDRGHDPECNLYRPRFQTHFVLYLRLSRCCGLVEELSAMSVLACGPPVKIAEKNRKSSESRRFCLALIAMANYHEWSPVTHIREFSRRA